MKIEKLILDDTPTCPVCDELMSFVDTGFSEDEGGQVSLYYCDGPAPHGGPCFSQKRVLHKHKGR